MATPDDSFLEEMGRRMRTRREALHLYSYQVAGKIGMPAPTYSKLERGSKKLIQPQQLARLARVLETTVDALLPPLEACS